MKIFLDCYYYQKAGITYNMSRCFPTATLIADSMEAAIQVAPRLGNTYDKIVITEHTKGANPQSIIWLRE